MGVPDRLVGVLLTALLVTSGSPVLAQEGAREDPGSGAVAGKVENRASQPVTDAVVTIVGLQWQARTDEQGRYRFGEVPSGSYVVTAISRRHGAQSLEVAIGTGAKVQLDFTLDPPSVRQEEVVVTAEASRRIVQIDDPTVVLEGRELESRLTPTLGESMTSLPGVNATSHTAGSSRPVLRGFAGDRARILEEGMGTADASAARQDNAVALDPQGAEAIEVRRGPSTLLYGTNVVGGVVNVTDANIPDRVPTRPLGGSVNLRRGSNADAKGQALILDGGGWSRFAWRASASTQRAGDTTAPDPVGVLENSDLDSEQLTVGASGMIARGYLGLARQAFETEYGIPTPRGVRVDLHRRRWNFGGEIPVGGRVPGVRLRVARTDYTQNETITTNGFENRLAQSTLEMRAEVQHRWAKGNDIVGLQAADRDLDVSGDQLYLPPGRSTDRSLFALEDLEVGPVDLQLAARWERRDVEVESVPESTAFSEARKRSFGGLSVAGGVAWNPHPTWNLELVYARTTRLPTFDELYVNGPHLATFQFEVGDPDLTEEHGWAIQVSVARTAGRVTGLMSAFFNDIDGYIYFTPTGNTVQVGGEEVPQVRILQRDARYRGAEAWVRVELLRMEQQSLRLELRGDTVRAEIDPFSPVVPEALPRIPATRFGVGLRYERETYWARVELLRVADQDRVALFEEPTEGYTMLGASAAYRLQSGSVVHDFLLRITNWTDELARNHVSTLKAIVPLPGRDITVAYKLLF